ncbi:hypothetical protein E2C01_065777 [Portunus trituberculatus]|uniref:Uncharacterized protein n=1 Tax=Portunus trituberculatus TaxID=210409 RepID=A0A5B7HP85_PORTR|nr:hypothetical protein [Portunus trituberculatus]
MVRALPVRRKLHRRAQEGRIPKEGENVTIPKGLDHPLPGPDALPLLPVLLHTSRNLQWYLHSVPSETPNGP